MQQCTTLFHYNSCMYKWMDLKIKREGVQKFMYKHKKVKMKGVVILLLIIRVVAIDAHDT